MVRSKQNKQIREEVRALEQQVEKLSKVIELLGNKSTEVMLSPGRVFIEQAVHVCETFLDTMVDEIRFKHKLHEIQQRNKCLNDQLIVYLELASQMNDTNKNSDSKADKNITDEDTILSCAYETIKRLTHSYSYTGEDGLLNQIESLFKHDQQESLCNGADKILLESINQIETSHPPDNKKDTLNRASMEIYMLGEFRVYIDSNNIETWPKGKGKQLFKYLVENRQSPIAKEVLMDLFWPEYDTDSARNNLNVAVYGLRQIFKKYLPDISHVIFKDGCYMFNPEIILWVDCEEFDERLKQAKKLANHGDNSGYIENIEKAEKLYQGEYLKDDLYLDWAFEERESYKEKYISILNKLDKYYFEKNEISTCVQLNKKIIATDACNEDAHQRLMDCYKALGQRHLALRQYHTCADNLRKELDLEPCQQINKLFHHIKHLESA